MNDIFASAYRDGFEMGYEEGVLIGSLECTLSLYKKGVLTLNKAAKICDMTLLEYMMYQEFSFKDIDKELL